MKKQPSDKKISLVIPSYKAEKTIKETLIATSTILSSIGNEYEIICVVDGELDRTKQIAKMVSKKDPHIKVLSYKKNRGKGHAVRYGMSFADGDIIGFIDEGLDIQQESLLMLLAHFEWYDADAIIGSKRHPASKVTYPWSRKILSYGYQLLVRVLFGLQVKDTQVGIKIFKKQLVKKVLPRLLVKQFAFDIEFLAVANYLGFKKIYEAPVELKLNFGTSSIVNKGFFKNVLGMLWDTCAVYYRLKILDFYNSKNKSMWINESEK